MEVDNVKLRKMMQIVNKKSWCSDSRLLFFPSAVGVYACECVCVCVEEEMPTMK